jgi:hypothetical protein
MNSLEIALYGIRTAESDSFHICAVLAHDPPHADILPQLHSLHQPVLAPKRSSLMQIRRSIFHDDSQSHHRLTERPTIASQLFHATISRRRLTAKFAFAFVALRVRSNPESHFRLSASEIPHRIGKVTREMTRKTA